MTYVGATPTTGDFKKLDSITTSSATTFNLRQGGVAVYPQSANHCIVLLNGVIQAPVDAFTIVNDTIVFASSLASSDVINFILVLGNVNDIGTPSDDTITAAKLNNTAISGLSALAATPDDTDELMISDAGTLKRIDYSYLKSTVVNRPNALPIIINGDMQINQRRSSSSSGLTSENGSYIIPDRWAYYMTDVGTYLAGAGAAGPTDYGFKKSLWLDNTTAKGTLDATSILAVAQKIEAQDCQLFNWGTSRAEKITVGFWVKATKTGTNIVELLQSDSDRICCQSYTVSSTDTWEFKVLNFPADTSGSVNNDKNEGLEVRFYLAAGSNYSSGTLATTWAARSNTNRAVGQVNNADHTDNNWQLSGVQVEIGEFTSSTIPPFQFETVAENLARCQRYYYKLEAASGGYFGSGNIDGSNDAQILVPFPCVMRTSPSAIETNGTASHYAIRTTSNVTCDAVPVFSNTDKDRAMVIFKKSSHGITNQLAAFGRSENNTAFLAWSAEL